MLVTDFGWPALTDFGIAATAGLASGAMVGMSIPWSPPEMLTDEPTGDVRSDVYSLAATIYSLLARRSPFEVLDASNSAADLISRIGRAQLAPTGRGDVPDSLQAVLARAMAKDAASRYHSALALARALQQVEAELMLPLTPLDLPDDMPAVAAVDPDLEIDQATRLRPVRTVSPEATEQLAQAAARAGEPACTIPRYRGARGRRPRRTRPSRRRPARGPNPTSMPTTCRSCGAGTWPSSRPRRRPPSRRDGVSDASSRRAWRAACCSPPRWWPW